MGWDAIITVDMDNLDIIAGDPDFGKKLVDAIKQHHGKKPTDVDAHSNGTFATGARVVYKTRGTVTLLLAGGKTLKIE